MSHELFALLLAAFCALYGLVSVAAHKYRPRITVDRHYAADGSITTTAKEIS